MLIGRDPFIFSIVLEPVREWNRNNDKYDFTFCNGIMQFSFLGKLFPNNEIQNITLECAVGELIRKLKNIPVNDNIYYEFDIEAAVKKIYSLVYTGDENEDLRYKVAPQEFFDKGYDVFGVRSSKDRTVRFIAAKSIYDKDMGVSEPVGELLHVYISLPYIDEMICGLEDYLKQIHEFPSKSIIYENSVKYISEENAVRIKNESSDTFIAEINGEKIKSDEDWIYTVAEAFHYPVYSEEEKQYIDPKPGDHSMRKSGITFNIFNDWSTDLSWIKESNIAMFITNVDKMYNSESILKDFEDNILHFWEYEAERIIVGGVRRRFMVYCID
ncbi:Imm42 family immunity protein [Ruminococcus flavefaciens]|uniref:Imm42 family immunity protein n=1 Tax=Ruminococcus flavefaciens TaxID=1265 RepID=UPI0026EFAEE4|nr:Imm42 family immunity protein [Ruminococcus flavefaciens]